MSFILPLGELPLRDARTHSITAPVPSPRLSHANSRVVNQEDTDNITGGFIASGVASAAALPTAIAAKGNIVQNYWLPYTNAYI